MKAVTETKIYNLIKLISSDVRISKEVSECLIRDLKEILACESHETKWGKLDMYKYTSTDKLRPVMMGVHYQDGWQVATDSKMLIKLKGKYNESYEGKTIGKDGSEIVGNFPRYNSVMPQNIDNWDEVEINYDELAEVIKRAKIHKKIYGDNKYSTQYLLRVGSNFYSLWLFEKFVKALKANNINTFSVNDKYKQACCKNENIEILMMAMSIREDDMEDYLNDESYFIEEI
jgi:hypothetical protein